MYMNSKNSKVVYLVNNKLKERGFEKSFVKIAKNYKLSLKSIRTPNLSYYYSRSHKTTTVFVNGKAITLENSHWLIRAWSPSEDATALLAIILELHKIPFTDARINAAHEIRTSKLSQTFQLGMKNCACPSTWVVHVDSVESTLRPIEKSISYPLVLKARGGLGKRVWKCNTRKDLINKISELRSENKDDLVIIQEIIENKGDIRVVIFQNTVIASIERSNTDGFLNNISQGGNARQIHVTKDEESLAIRASKAIGLDLAGVDIVRSKFGPLLFEVNKAPDICSFNEAAGFDIATIIAQRYFDSITKSSKQ